MSCVQEGWRGKGAGKARSDNYEQFFFMTCENTGIENDQVCTGSVDRHDNEQLGMDCQKKKSTDTNSDKV